MVSKLLSGISVSCEEKNNLSQMLGKYWHIHTGAVFTLQGEWNGDFSVRNIFVLDFLPHLFYIMAD